MHNKQSRMVPFVLGIIMGILCTIYLPKYVRPYLPEALMDKDTVVKGTVTAKEKKGDALLLTVNTSDGALLATFKKKADEVGLLVNEKDEIQFTLPKYVPFIDDPKIIRVAKEQQAVPLQAETSTPPARGAEKSTKEMKPRQQARTQVAAPVPGKSMDAKPPEGVNNEQPAGGTKME